MSESSGLTADGLESELTARERDVSRLELLDFAVGYPELPVPDWLAQIWYESPLSELLARFLRRHPDVNATHYQRLPSSLALEHCFVRAALEFLNLPSTLAGNSFVTFSGSIALERALAIAVKPNGLARLPTPIFDVIPGFLRQRGVELDWWELHPGAPEWTAATMGLNAHDATVVVSPDNPSGEVIPEAILRKLADEAFASHSVLVADQSFALLSSSGSPAPLLAGVAERAQSWIMVWDTGKTFDLDDEKIGIIVVSDDLRSRAMDAIGLVQCALPRRLTMQMTLILEEAGRAGYIEWLASVRRESERLLRQFADDVGATVDVPHWGGFATVDLLGLDVNIVVSEAQRIGLGLLTTMPFSRRTPLEGQVRPQLRLPLMRRAAMVRDSLDRLATVVRVMTSQR